jgi:hypothetical protein
MSGHADQRALIETIRPEGGKSKERLEILERGEHTYKGFDVSRKRKVRL